MTESYFDGLSHADAKVAKEGVGHSRSASQRNKSRCARQLSLRAARLSPMNEFAFALAAFVVLHVGVSATGLRTRLVAMIGEGPYRGVFSLASLALLIWLIHGYGVMRADPFDQLNVDLWSPPTWLMWPAIVLVFVGFMLAVTGLFTPGPTLAGFEARALAQAEPARGVLRITRHPFLWGVAFWAAGHALVNGERFAVMLFGAMALMAILGARSIDRKGEARNPEGWARFAAVTSNAPFVAILRGQNKFALGEMGWRLGVAVLVFVAMVFLHPRLIGVPAISMLS